MRFWSEASERNQQPILDVLSQLLDASRNYRVLEIGSGTGQHALHISAHLPNVDWQTSDLTANLDGLVANLNTHQQVSKTRLKPPLELDARTLEFVSESYDMVYTANTCHIMSWVNAQLLIKNAGKLLSAQGLLVIYGPFNIGGLASSDSNYRFDVYLSQSDPRQGIRNREDIAWVADAHGLSLQSRYDMPANNQILVFEKRSEWFVG